MINLHQAEKLNMCLVKKWIQDLANMIDFTDCRKSLKDRANMIDSMTGKEAAALLDKLLDSKYPLKNDNEYYRDYNVTGNNYYSYQVTAYEGDHYYNAFPSRAYVPN